MSRYFWILLVGLLFPAPELRAQTTAPTLQAYGGYSLLRPRLPESVGNGDRSLKELGEFSLNNVLGWNAGATWKVSPSIGITADISGYYRSLDTEIDGVPLQGRARIHAFLFGPQYSGKGDRVQPFARILAGVGRLYAEGTVDTDHVEESSTAFAASLGGGLDFVVNSRLSVRAVQFDYFPVRNSRGGGLTFHNVRWGTGLLVRLR
jgi:hypothetical protein